ncbi:Basement membrane-specific heparan sulfate proteoglycan core protein [Sarracenia purpurea var. burkii]
MNSNVETDIAYQMRADAMESKIVEIIPMNLAAQVRQRPHRHLLRLRVDVDLTNSRAKIVIVFLIIADVTDPWTAEMVATNLIVRRLGPLRSPVTWTRGNGSPLPVNSVVTAQGRLEIPNIQVSHSGAYTCKALEPYSRYPGSEISVYLTVEPFVPITARPVQSCGYNESTCLNGDCVRKEFMCNGRYDCADGSDEMRCNPLGCEPDQFRCLNGMCVQKNWRCDGENDCKDGSDETNCAPSPPEPVENTFTNDFNYSGSSCRHDEFQCTGNVTQCVPKAFHCDGQNDCFDGTDEVGCSKVFITQPPPPLAQLLEYDTFNITCVAVGVPMPEIVWRLNWGHVPDKCTSTSINGVGVLTCYNVQVSDSGAYSCEAINNKGFVVATPDCILVVLQIKPPGCPVGQFNDLAVTQSECISCFCFGATSSCQGANLFVFDVKGSFDPKPIFLPYFSYLSAFNGNQLKSYGGFIKYNIRYDTSGSFLDTPLIIISGNGSGSSSGGDQPSIIRPTLASREEIMMILVNVEQNRIQYTDSRIVDTVISNFKIDSAAATNTGLGKAAFVEQCSCPPGYSGLSCESCASGYSRVEGSWLGRCYRIESCAPGTYGDPLQGYHVNLALAHPAILKTNLEERAFEIQMDNPLANVLPDMLVDVANVVLLDLLAILWFLEITASQFRSLCNPDGSTELSGGPPCNCKPFATGTYCDQCKTSAFHLASTNPYGCISCFCMGVTTSCTSSSWYRQLITTTFIRSTEDFKIVRRQDIQRAITDELEVRPNEREIIYSSFSPSDSSVYYWLLPQRYLGDKVSSYGGVLIILFDTFQSKEDNHYKAFLWKLPKNVIPVSDLPTKWKNADVRKDTEDYRAKNATPDLLNCGNHTVGPDCGQCEPGYTGNPKSGQACYPSTVDVIATQRPKSVRLEETEFIRVAASGTQRASRADVLRVLSSSKLFSYVLHLDPKHPTCTLATSAWIQLLPNKCRASELLKSKLADVLMGTEACLVK